MPSGSMRALFRSRITSDGAALRISVSAAAADRAKITATPSWPAVVLIFDMNIRSSRTAKIIDRHDSPRRNRRPLHAERLRGRMRGDARGGAHRPRGRRAGDARLGGAVIIDR